MGNACSKIQAIMMVSKASLQVNAGVHLHDKAPYCVHMCFFGLAAVSQLSFVCMTLS